MGIEKHDLYLLLAMVGGIALVLLAGLYFGGFLGGWSARLSETSERVHERAESFLVAIRDQRYGDALELMEPRYRRDVPLAAFRETVRGDRFLPSIHSGDLGRVRTYGGSAAVLSGSLTGDGGTLDAEIHLTLADSDWYVTEVVLGGRPVLSRDGGR